MSIQDKLQATIIAFTEWRNSRAMSNKKTPGSLRRQAIALMPHYSTSQIVSALKLNHAQLKLWAETISADEKVVSFVPLSTIEEKTVTEQLDLEVRLNNGTQLRLSGPISSSQICSLLQILAAQDGVRS